MGGDRFLAAEEQAALRRHYPVMMAPARYPPALVETLYARRRRDAVRAVRERPGEWVFDAGCGFGSESFLFAAAGAQVLAVDRSAAQLAIAEKRRRFFAERLGRPLAIDFEVADLDRYTPPRSDLALTWLASVLAAIADQEALLARIHGSTRAGGRVMITDMNLLNPWFALGEWRRRRRMAAANPAFAAAADFAAMFFRRGRRGASYYHSDEGAAADDVQFFSAPTLARLVRSVGFTPRRVAYSGLMPPIPGVPGLGRLEAALATIPALRALGYFYLLTAEKTAGADAFAIGGGGGR